MSFVHLHVHSTFSFLDGHGLPKQIAREAATHKMTVIALTDHGNMSGHVQFEDACKKYGIKPIFGMEAYVVDDAEDKQRSKYHLTLLAKNRIGYKNLLKLHHFSYQKGFYYKPSVDWKILQECAEGLIVLSGCYFSKVGRDWVTNEDQNSLENELLRQKSIFENYYIEIQPLEFGRVEALTKALTIASKHTGIPLVATNDVHYLRKDFQMVNTILAAVRTRKKLEDYADDNPETWLRTEKEMREAFKRWKWFDNYDALSRTEEIVDLCEEYPLPKSKTLTLETEKPDEMLYELICKGIEKKFNNVLPEGYGERLDQEFSLIKKKGFCDYFLLVSDISNWAKSQGILMSPGRGSSAGSLICYLLNITEVDPIPHGLLFSRFIDEARIDAPDVDLDFEDERRDEVKQYLISRFGVDRVADVGSFTKFKGKNIADDIQRVTDIPYNIIYNLKSDVDIQGSFVNAYASRSEYSDYPILEYGILMEGQLRQMSSHPAGVVVSNSPLEEIAPICERDGRSIVGVDYRDLQTLGLMKIDVLGLKALSIIKHALRAIKEINNEGIDLYNLPLDSQKVYQKFCEKDVLGVFQFEGRAQSRLVKDMQPVVFKDLVAINALSRPGPLNSGTTKAYIEDRNMAKENVFDSNYMKKILPETYGHIVFQEQVMKVVQEIAGFTPQEAIEVRKIVSKSKGDQLLVYKSKFIKGALSSDYIRGSVDKAQQLWDSIETFGRYAFNLSHATVYSVLGYWMMYLKTYYPLPFYYASIYKSNDEKKTEDLLREFTNRGYEVYFPKINQSKADWTLEKNGIRAGYRSIKGIGEKAANCLEENQPFSSYEDLKSRTPRKTVNSRVLNLLKENGALEDLDDGESQMRLI